ncbi:MAG: hypothetical protein WAX89_05975, partial [Alphaproteobacteria bacterium]
MGIFSDDTDYAHLSGELARQRDKLWKCLFGLCERVEQAGQAALIAADPDLQTMWAEHQKTCATYD